MWDEGRIKTLAFYRVVHQKCVRARYFRVNFSSDPTSRVFGAWASQNTMSVHDSGTEMYAFRD